MLVEVYVTAVRYESILLQEIHLVNIFLSDQIKYGMEWKLKEWRLKE